MCVLCVGGNGSGSDSDSNLLPLFTMQTFQKCIKAGALICNLYAKTPVRTVGIYISLKGEATPKLNFNSDGQREGGKWLCVHQLSFGVKSGLQIK